MDQKRIRSQNWDEEEKLLFRSVLREYANVIENKCLDTNTIKIKTKAWEEVHKKFNELNSRHRQLSQLKIQWKTMKLNARKTYSTFKKELSKTGGGARPATPNDGIIDIKDLLNPAELLRDHNIYDSDGIIESSSSNKVILATTSETCDNTLQDVKPVTYVVKYLDTQNVDENINPENQQIADYIIENTDAQENAQEFTSSVVSQDAIGATPMNKNMGMTSAKKVPKRKLISNNKKDYIIENTDAQENAQEFTSSVVSQDAIGATPMNKNMGMTSAKKVPKRKLISNNKKNHDDYVNNMLSHSKKLKEEEHRRRLEMAEEEHAIKIEIHKEKLKCAILEREILELRKVREEQN